MALPMAPPYPTTCTNDVCESTLLEWHLAVRPSNHAPLSGRLTLSDAVPRLYLACEECGEMLGLIEDDGPLNELLAAEPPRIEVNIVPPERATALKILEAVDPLYAAILKIMRRDAGNPTHKIAQALGHPEWKIQPMVLKLDEAGLIQRGEGGWRLP